MPISETIVKELETIALEGGATAVKLVDPQDVVVAQWVRLKCQFGCSLFGKCFSCPPYSPTPQETAATLQSYQKTLLVEFGNLRTGETEIDEVLRRVVKIEKKMQKVMYRMERAAFLGGCERAFSYDAGPCALCLNCQAEKLETPSLFCRKECVHPEEFRPSMEGAGIDVYSTVRRAGFELSVVRELNDTFKEFCLLLLE